MSHPALKELIEMMRNSLVTMGQLSVDPRLNQQEKDAISLVAGYAAAAFEEATGEDAVHDFYKGSHNDRQA